MGSLLDAVSPALAPDWGETLSETITDWRVASYVLPDDLKHLGRPMENVAKEMLAAGYSSDDVARLLGNTQFQEIITRAASLEAMAGVYGANGVVSADAQPYASGTINEDGVLTITLTKPQISVGMTALGLLSDVQSFVDTLPTEEAAMVMFGVGLATGGPIKKLAQEVFNVAAEILAGDTVAEAFDWMSERLTLQVLGSIPGQTYDEQKAESPTLFEYYETGAEFALTAILGVSGAKSGSRGNKADANVNAPNRTGVDGIKDVTGHTLIAHENWGGHTISKHVGKTDADLSARLSSDPSLTSASSFPDIDTASGAVANTISTNQSTVSSWMSGSSPKLVISSTSNSSVGSVMQQGATASVATNKTTVVLVKDPLSANGYTVLTSYPDL